MRNRPYAADVRRYRAFAARSEVTLGANLQQERVLILELVERGRLRSGRRECRAARHLLVEMEPLHFARERQVLDGCPAEVGAELRDVEVGIAGVVACSVSDQCLTAVALRKRRNRRPWPWCFQHRAGCRWFRRHT